MTTYRNTIDASPRATRPATFLGQVLAAVYGGPYGEGRRPSGRIERTSRPFTYSRGWPYSGR